MEPKTEYEHGGKMTAREIAVNIWSALNVALDLDHDRPYPPAQWLALVAELRESLQMLEEAVNGES